MYGNYQYVEPKSVPGMWQILNEDGSLFAEVFETEWHYLAAGRRFDFMSAAIEYLER